MVKLEFKNAFNLLRRDAFVREVHQYFPSLLPFYVLGISNCFFCEQKIDVAAGNQQGDRLALFYFTFKAIVNSLSIELNI